MGKGSFQNLKAMKRGKFFQQGGSSVGKSLKRGGSGDHIPKSSQVSKGSQV